jgi:hypothetical protein
VNKEHDFWIEKSGTAIAAGSENAGAGIAKAEIAKRLARNIALFIVSLLTKLSF